MANENLQTLNTRILLRYDEYTNWYNNNPKLMRGEIAIATIPENHTNPSTGEVTQIPAVVMKVGTGAETGSNYRDLPFVSAKAADVLAACKTENGLKAFVNGVIADAGIATNEAMETLAGRVDDAETLLATLNGGEENDGSVLFHIKEAIDALDLANTYAGKSHTHVKADITDFAHTHTVSEINDFDSSVKAYDYATKTEAQGYADAKDEAIAAAKKAGDDAQAAVNVLNGSGEGSVDAKVSAAVAALVDGAPDYLNTLKEIADWINDDETASTALVEEVNINTSAINDIKDGAAELFSFKDVEDKLDLNNTDLVTVPTTVAEGFNTILRSYIGDTLTDELPNDVGSTLVSNIITLKDNIGTLEETKANKTYVGDLPDYVVLEDTDNVQTVHQDSVINYIGKLPDKFVDDTFRSEGTVPNVIDYIDSKTTDDLVQGTKTLIFNCGDSTN